MTTPSARRRGLRLYLTGFCMGTADLIPGVSGGTIAFISGIYEELLFSIQLVTGEVLRHLLKGNIRQAVQLIPFRFLLPLAAGMATALFGLAHTLSWLLEHHPQQLWGFFFALVLASTWIVLKQVPRWNPTYVIAFLLSALGAFFLVGLSPVETPFTNWMIFLSGFIAICAMILPGISGSFILLLLGKYRQILDAVVERDFVTLIIFIFGCILGLSLFARLLRWLFKRYHSISVSILAGFMLGSVRKIWPWQSTNGDLCLPTSLTQEVVFTLLLAAAGFAMILWLDRFKILKEHTHDLNNQGFTQEHNRAIAHDQSS